VKDFVGDGECGLANYLVIMWQTVACPSLATVLCFYVKVINIGAKHLSMILTAQCTYNTI
jgi:hypothetical protein